jgi:hypothetical protein
VIERTGTPAHRGGHPGCAQGRRAQTAAGIRRRAG